MKNPLENPGSTVILGLLLTALLYGFLRLTAPAEAPSVEASPAVTSPEGTGSEEGATDGATSSAELDGEAGVEEPASEPASP
ncbi:MAG: hypothetical protein VKO21_09075 [Candidatus Sericytochromatia bacterium]|nr:hypothetical protein [Candidatus Sericytochromatia bacterium]